jgi:hypothetical protein
VTRFINFPFFSDAVIAQYKHSIETNEADVNEVVRLEKVEKELRVAEMQANRATNLMVHEKGKLVIFFSSSSPKCSYSSLLFLRDYVSSCPLVVSDRERASGRQVGWSRCRL